MTPRFPRAQRTRIRSKNFFPQTLACLGCLGLFSRMASRAKYERLSESPRMDPASDDPWPDEDTEPRLCCEILCKRSRDSALPPALGELVSASWASCWSPAEEMEAGGVWDDPRFLLAFRRRTKRARKGLCKIRFGPV